MDRARPYGTSPFMGFIAGYGDLTNRSLGDRGPQTDALRASAPALGYLVRHQKQFPALLAWQLFRQPPRNLVQHQPHQRLGPRQV